MIYYEVQLFYWTRVNINAKHASPEQGTGIRYTDTVSDNQYHIHNHSLQKLIGLKLWPER
jgi:hypothetical protein